MITLRRTTPAQAGTGRRLVRRLALAGAAALAGAGLALGGTASAQADTATDGWVRVAHLSPDTKSVDVTLTALAGGDAVAELDDVAYGAVSDYMDLPQGTYVVSMVPAGAPDGTTPVIQQSVEVKSGQPVTVAAYGRNSDLSTTVFPDDLTPPSDGQARIRVIQASTTAPTVDIATDTGMTIATDAAQGTATGYASVPAGPWNLDLTGGTQTDQASVDLASGSVATLFVLDNASGGVTVKPVVDAASVGDLPTGGIQTGGGATGVHVSGAQSSAADPGVVVAWFTGGALALIAAAAFVRRGRRAATGAAITASVDREAR